MNYVSVGALPTGLKAAILKAPIAFQTAQLVQKDNSRWYYYGAAGLGALALGFLVWKKHKSKLSTFAPPVKPAVPVKEAK